MYLFAVFFIPQRAAIAFCDFDIVCCHKILANARVFTLTLSGSFCYWW